MSARKGGFRTAVRYSEAFKLEVVRELERELTPVDPVRRKYGIGVGTIQAWIAEYGNGTRGKVIRVETPKEIDEVKKLRQRIKRLESLLADTNLELALERQYTRLACERAGGGGRGGVQKKSRWEAAHGAIEQDGDLPGVKVGRLCRELGMSRQNYYARRKERQRKRVDEELVVALVRQERSLQPRLGARKLRVLLEPELAQAGVGIGRDRFFEILRAQGLLLEPKRSETPRTTQSYHTLPMFRNLIKGGQFSQPTRSGWEI